MKEGQVDSRWAVLWMGPASEGVGVAGAGKTPPADDWVGMALPKSAQFLDLDLPPRSASVLQVRNYATDAGPCRESSCTVAEGIGSQVQRYSSEGRDANGSTSRLPPRPRPRTPAGNRRRHDPRRNFAHHAQANHILISLSGQLVRGGSPSPEKGKGSNLHYIPRHGNLITEIRLE